MGFIGSGLWSSTQFPSIFPPCQPLLRMIVPQTEAQHRPAALRRARGTPFFQAPQQLCFHPGEPRQVPNLAKGVPLPPPPPPDLCSSQTGEWEQGPPSLRPRKEEDRNKAKVQESHREGGQRPLEQLVSMQPLTSTAGVKNKTRSLDAKIQQDVYKLFVNVRMLGAC